MTWLKFGDKKYKFKHLKIITNYTYYSWKIFVGVANTP